MSQHNVPNVCRKMGISPTHRYIPGVGWFTAEDDWFLMVATQDSDGRVSVDGCTGVGFPEEPVSPALLEEYREATANPLEEPAIIQPLGGGRWSKP